MKYSYNKPDTLSEAHVSRYMNWNAHFLHRYRKLGTDALELRLGDIVLTADLADDVEGVDMSTAATALSLSRQTARRMINEWVSQGHYQFERAGRSTYIRLTPKRRAQAVKRAKGIIEMMFDCISDVTAID